MEKYYRAKAMVSTSSGLVDNSGLTEGATSFFLGLWRGNDREVERAGRQFGHVLNLKSTMLGNEFFSLIESLSRTHIFRRPPAQVPH